MTVPPLSQKIKISKSTNEQSLIAYFSKVVHINLYDEHDFLSLHNIGKDRATILVRQSEGEERHYLWSI